MPLPSVTFRSELPPIVRKELDQLDSELTAYLLQEHDDDGQHTHITASSLTVTGPLAVLGGPITVNGVEPQQTLTFVIAHFASPGSGIATGFSGVLVVPWACTITQVTLLSADPALTSGSMVVDIWKAPYANYPPTVADSICASAKPTLSGAIKSQDATLVGWTTALAADDILAFNVESVTSVKRVRLDLRVTLV